MRNLSTKLSADRLTTDLDNVKELYNVLNDQVGGKLRGFIRDLYNASVADVQQTILKCVPDYVNDIADENARKEGAALKGQDMEKFSWAVDRGMSDHLSNSENHSAERPNTNVT